MNPTSKTCWQAFLLVITVVLILPSAAVTARGSFGFDRVSDPVTIERSDSGAVPVTGHRGQFRVSVRMDSGWHVNAQRGRADLIPLSVKPVDTGIVESVSVEMPKPVRYEFPFSKTPLMVYEGTVAPIVVFRLGSGVHPDGRTVDWTVRYQACSKDQCLRPAEQTLSVPLTGTGNGSDQNLKSVGEKSEPARSRETATKENASAVRQYFGAGEWFLGFALIFLLGLTLNLTPCVYPLIPVTIGYFTKSDRTPMRVKTVNAGLFVAGIILTYSALGAIAGLTGNVFGSVLQHPGVNLFLAGLVLIMALSLFDLYQVTVPGSLRRWADTVGDRLGPFGMGTMLGVVAAPCVAPATVSLLALVGRSGNVAFGFSVFLMLGTGLAVPYFFLAVFSGSLDRLPHSGEWLQWVENLLGCLLVGVALYFIWPFLSSRTMGWILVAWLLTSGLYLSLTHRPEQFLLTTLRGGVITATTLVLVILTHSTFIDPLPSVQWESGQSFLESRQPFQKPLVVYFGADWCFPCKRMETGTFSHQRVRNLSKHVRMIKIDLTRSPSPPVQNWMKSKEVKGVPVMLFIKRNGKEVRSLRTSGYVSAEELVRKIKVLRTAPMG